MAFRTTMMESVAVHQRPQISRDASMGVVQTYATVASNLPCCVGSGGSGGKTLYGQNNASVGATIYFADNPGVEPNDRLLVTDRLGVVRAFLCKGQAQPLGRGHTWQVSADYTAAPGVEEI